MHTQPQKPPYNRKGRTCAYTLQIHLSLAPTTPIFEGNHQNIMILNPRPLQTLQTDQRNWKI